MEWSKEQKEAIYTKDMNLLVSAAAGSGKTAVLVERIINNVIYNNYDIDKLLVVTFTRAAAAEMKERIGRALEQKAKDKDLPIAIRERANQEVLRLSRASIMTLDAFCQILVRQNFSLVDIDPNFRIANEQEILMLKQDILEDIFEKEYRKGEHAFLDLLSAYGTDRDDVALYELIFRVFEFSESALNPSKWLESLVEPYKLMLDINAYENFTHSKWLQIIKTLLALYRNAWLRRLENLILKAKDMEIFRYQEFLVAEQEMLEKATAYFVDDTQQGFPWDEAVLAMAHIDFLKWPTAKKDEPKAEIATLKEERDELKKEVQNMAKYFFSNKEPLFATKLIDDLRKVAPEVEKIVAITLAFAKAFAKEKKDKLLVTFDDIKHFALDILEAREEGHSSTVAQMLQDTYEEVMIDEYQDTNEVDEAILKHLVSKKRRNFFAVGDVKQSIYRFRLANPSLFLEKYENYPTREDAKRIDLAKNFRSRAKILAGINFIFHQLMQKETMELDYDEKVALYHGLEYPALDEANLFTGSIDLDLIDEKTSHSQTDNVDTKNAKVLFNKDEVALRGIELEGEHIALKIKTLKNSSMLVYDKDLHGKTPYRPLMWRDIVILLRATSSGQAEIIEERLKNHGIPAYSTGTQGYFQTLEVKIILNLLSVIDNSLQDIPLAAVLHSPIVSLSAEDLSAIHLLTKKFAPQQDFYLYEALALVNSPEAEFETLEQERVRRLKEKVDNFLRKMSMWQKRARILSVANLLFEIYQDTGYYDYVGGLPNGVARQANLRMLITRANEYEKTSFRGLFRFLRFIEKMKRLDNDLSVARTLGENEDVVRIMTIHKSKGLEFPVVIVANMGKKFRVKTDLFPLHRDFGIGVARNDLEINIRYPTIAKWALSEVLKREEQAEELRIFYVALTRAREKLILVGRTDISAWAKKVSQYIHEEKLPPYAPLFAKSYLEWIGICLARHTSGTPIREWGDAYATPIFLDKLAFSESASFNIEKITLPILQENQETNVEKDHILEKIRQRDPLTTDDIKGTSQINVEEILAWDYPLSYLQEIPAKLTVSEVKRRFQEQNEEDKAYIMQEKKEYFFKRPLFMEKERGITSTEYGTLIHTALQHLSFTEHLTIENIRQQLDEMVTSEILPREERKAIREKMLFKFFQTDLGKRLVKAKKVWRELAFTHLIPAHFIDKSILHLEAKKEFKEEILTQGIIDVLFEDARGLVLLDYKTDRHIAEFEALKRYQIQMELYADAVEHIMGKEINEIYLVLLSEEKNIRVERKYFFH